MRVGDPTSESVAASQALFDATMAEQILRADAGIDWPAGHTPSDIRIERGWPQRHGNFAAEWSFLLDDRRHAVFASTQSTEPPQAGASQTRPTVTGTGLRSLDIHVANWGVWLHTPDCDTDLPHLARCLDAADVGLAIRPYLRNGSVSQNEMPDAHLLGYRAGKRAAIAYRLAGGERILGKTFRDNRGERLIALHIDLAARLLNQTGDGPTLSVAPPVGYLPEFNMALFEWCDHGRNSSDEPIPGETAFRAVDALAVLHSVAANAFPVFTQADERVVIERWHGALGAIAPPLADLSAALVAALISLTDVESDPSECMVHRDFYEKQFLYRKGEITLLDLDTLAKGSPCIDLGNLLAHLCLAHTAADNARGGYFALAAEVVERYARRRGAIDRSAMIFYWASAAFRVGAVHALRTATRTHTSRLWSLAEALLHHQGALPVQTIGFSSSDTDFAPILRWTNS